MKDFPRNRLLGGELHHAALGVVISTLLLKPAVRTIPGTPQGNGGQPIKLRILEAPNIKTSSILQIVLLSVVCAVIIACSSGRGGPNWVEVQSWQSQGNGDSPIFRIAEDSWRVVWRAEIDSVGEGRLIILAYSSDGTLVTELFNTRDIPESALRNPSVGALGLRGPGEFFIRVETTRAYNITMEENK